MSYQREHLKACVAMTLAGQREIDAANETRDLIGGDYWTAKESTRFGIEQGWYEPTDEQDEIVVTTAGIFEAIS